MLYFFKCLCLCLILYTHYCSSDNRRLFRDFKVKQKEYAILSSNNHAQGQDNNIICQTAKCDYKSNTIYNVTSPECGNHYTCQECPASFGTDICYLGITSDGWVLVTEGSLQLVNNNRIYTNNEKPKEEKNGPKGYEDVYDEDEEAFLELNNEDNGLFDYQGTSFVHKFVATQTFSYSDHHGEKWLAENKKQCQVDKDGNLELSVRLIFQYFRSPLDVSADMGQNPNNQGNYQHGDDMSALELSESSSSGSGCSKKGTFSTRDKTDSGSKPSGNGSSASGVSLMQVGFFGKGDEDDGDDSDGGEGGNVFSTAAKRGFKLSLRKGSELKKKLGSAIKFLYEKAQVMIAKPEIHIHFVVDDIKIKNCRQPLSWAGEMSSGAMLFVANQNFKLRHEALTIDFLKKAVRVHASVRGIYDLAFNSCVQLHCTKSTPVSLQYLTLPPQGKNFSISNRLMGYLNRPGFQPGHVQVVTGATAPSQALNTPVVAAGAPAAMATPNAPSPSALNGVSNSATIHLHNNPPKPENQATPTNAQNPPGTPDKTPPATNLPGFHGPVTHNVGAFGGIIQSDGNKTRFYIFMGVGILILIMIGYFFFFK